MGDVHFAFDQIGLQAIISGPCDRNNICSPLSLVLATGILAFDLEEEERDLLLENWLGISRETSDAALAEALKFQADSFKQLSRGRNHMYWDFVVHPEADVPNRLKDCLENHLHMPVRRVSFPSPGVSIINKACRKATNGIIKDLVSPSLHSHSIILANAIYTDKAWGIRMRKEKSFSWKLPMSSYRRRFFGTRGEFKYGSTPSYHYVCVPMNDGCEMEFFFTKSRFKLPVTLTIEDMTALRASASPRTINLFLPNFAIEQSPTDFGALMESMGVVFDNNMLTKTCQIAQSAKIQAGREGISAAVVTEVIIEGESAEKEPDLRSPFKVNRPFICTLRHGSVTDFMGYLYDCPKIDTLESCGC